MTTIILDTDNDEDLQKVTDFADKNGMNLLHRKPSIADLIKAGYTNGKAVAEALQRIADAGGARSFSNDASAWQREIREDRPLTGR